MAEFHGGQAYDMVGKTMRQQAEALLGALDTWGQTHSGHCIVWLNPAMRHVGEYCARLGKLDWVEWRYDVAVKPAIHAYLEGVR